MLGRTELQEAPGVAKGAGDHNAEAREAQMAVSLRPFIDFCPFHAQALPDRCHFADQQTLKLQARTDCSVSVLASFSLSWANISMGRHLHIYLILA